MKLDKLQLVSFRSYDKYELILNKKTLVITGENGCGKTNILEAAYFLSTGKTFRSSDQDNLIKFGMDYFIVKGEVSDDTVSASEKSATERKTSHTTPESESLEVAYANYPRKQKIFKVNDVPTPHAKYLGNLITVLFHPKDLNLLYMEPSLRRKYINLLLSQTDREYLESLTNYTKILKQRNVLLDEIAEKNVSESELDIWDERLADEGSKIIFKRIEAVEILSKNLHKNYKKISGGSENARALYSSSVTLAEDAIASTETAQATEADLNPAVESNSSSENTKKAIEIIKKSFQKKLLLKRDKDIRFGNTSVGPHRDDIKLTLDDNPIEEFASRGESRTALIALKLAEIAYIEKKTKTSPLLLLDDVFSELDENRQKYLLEALKSCQSIITSVDVPKNLGNSEDIEILHL